MNKKKLFKNKYKNAPVPYKLLYNANWFNYYNWNNFNPNTFNKRLKIALKSINIKYINNMILCKRRAAYKKTHFYKYINELHRKERAFKRALNSLYGVMRSQ